MHKFRKINNLFFILYLLPAVFILWFISKFALDIPYMDQWSLVPFFEKIYDGKATFTDFFAPHNEHRLFFPKLIFVVLAFLTNWQIRYELYFNFILACITCFSIYKLSITTQKPDKFLSKISTILTCLLIFSLMQYENWLWGFQLANQLINTCLVVATFILTSFKEWSVKKRVIIAAILCFIASFSSAQGLLTWLALLPAVAFLENNSNGDDNINKEQLDIWGCFFIISGLLYAIGYDKPVDTPSFIIPFEQPFNSLFFALNVLGFPILSVVAKPGAVFILGLIISVLFITISWYIFKHFPEEFRENLTPWVCLGIFAILFAIMTTIGRGALPIEFARISRYTTNSLLLIVAFIQILRFFVSLYPSDRIQVFKGIYGVLSGVFLAIFISNSIFTFAHVQEFKKNIDIGKNCLNYIYLFNETYRDQSYNNCLKNLYPDAEEIKNNAEIMDKLYFREFPLDANLNLPMPNQTYGNIDKPASNEKPLIVNKNSTGFSIAGWAILPETKKNPQVVFLSNNKSKSFFATAIINTERPDVAAYFKNKRFLKSGWAVDISSASLPPGKTIINAWVYDASNDRFFKLKGEAKILLQ